MKSYINTYSAAIFVGVFSLGRTVDMEGSGYSGLLGYNSI